MEGDDQAVKLKDYERPWLNKRVRSVMGAEGTVTCVVRWRDDAGAHVRAWVAVDGRGMDSIDVRDLVVID